MKPDLSDNQGTSSRLRNQTDTPSTPVRPPQGGAQGTS